MTQILPCDRPCWAADGATCNLCSRCRTREGNHWSKGRKIRNHELFGACGHSLWTAQDTEWGTWIWGGWVSFPPQRALQWYSFTKCCCFGCFVKQRVAGRSLVSGSLPSVEQMILAPGLLCLYPTNVLTSKSGVHVGFAVVGLTLNIFAYVVFYKRAVCPKDTIWLLVIKSVFQPGKYSKRFMKARLCGCDTQPVLKFPSARVARPKES